MTSFIGLFIACFFMLFFGWLFYSAYAMGIKDYSKPNISSIFWFCLYSLASAVLVYYLLTQRHTIDISDWWTRSYNNMLMLFSHPFLAILRLGGTVLFGEYNTLPCMIIALPLKLFGYTFVRYVLINYVFFFVPVCFIMFSLLRKILQEGGGRDKLFLFLIFIFTPIQIPKTAGFIDVACMIPAALAILLIDDYDALTFNKTQIKRDVYISVLLLLSMLFRRYFACFIVGYMVGLALLSVYQVSIYSGAESKLKMLRNAILNICVIALVALIIMAIFLGPLLLRILRNKYSVIYEADNLSTGAKLLVLADTYGWLLFVFASIGLILSLARKKFRKYACFCTISVLVTVYSFYRVQGYMNTFHAYIFMLQMFILTVIGMVHIVELLKDNVFWKNFALSIYVIIFTVNFLNCYVPQSRLIFSGMSCMFDQAYSPDVRNDIDQLYELADYTNSLTNDTSKSVYILAGTSLSEYTMEYLHKPYKEEGLNRQIKGRGDIIIDGFPVNILIADIIITSFTDSDDDNNVHRIIARNLNDSTSLIGRHFTKNSRTFNLDGGAEVVLFEKQHDFSDDDLHELAEYFTELYPGKEDLYAKRILGRLSQWDIQGQRNRGLAIRGIKWLLNRHILTPEQLAAVTDRSVEEINMLAEN